MGWFAHSTHKQQTLPDTPRLAPVENKKVPTTQHRGGVRFTQADDTAGGFSSPARSVGITLGGQRSPWCAWKYHCVSGSVRHDCVRGTWCATLKHWGVLWRKHQFTAPGHGVCHDGASSGGACHTTPRRSSISAGNTRCDAWGCVCFGCRL